MELSASLPLTLQGSMASAISSLAGAEKMTICSTGNVQGLEVTLVK